MLIAKISATLAVVCGVGFLISAALTKQRGDMWDRVFNTSVTGAMFSVAVLLISFIWGI
jgi:hypothetical protein